MTRAAVRSLQQVRVRGCRFQAPGVGLFERTEPPLDQDEVPDWKRDNAERHKLFERPRKPEPTEAQKTLAKKREELARVLERLRHLAAVGRLRDIHRAC